MPCSPTPMSSGDGLCSLPGESTWDRRRATHFWAGSRRAGQAYPRKPPTLPPAPRHRDSTVPECWTHACVIGLPSGLRDPCHTHRLPWTSPPAPLSIDLGPRDDAGSGKVLQRRDHGVTGGFLGQGRWVPLEQEQQRRGGAALQDARGTSGPLPTPDSRTRS